MAGDEKKNANNLAKKMIGFVRLIVHLTLKLT